jgi:hypothetical protein
MIYDLLKYIEAVEFAYVVARHKEVFKVERALTKLCSNDRLVPDFMMHAFKFVLDTPKRNGKSPNGQ